MSTLRECVPLLMAIKAMAYIGCAFPNIVVAGLAIFLLL
jgi:hypothetical protein